MHIVLLFQKKWWRNSEKISDVILAEPVHSNSKSWEEGQALILLKNEKYFEKDNAGQRLPYLDAIKVTFYENKATEFLMFQQKQLDFINDIDASFKDEVLTKKGELKDKWKDKIVLE